MSMIPDMNFRFFKLVTFFYVFLIQYLTLIQSESDVLDLPIYNPHPFGHNLM